MNTPSKTAVTAAPLHPLLADRWSPRAFDSRHELTDVQLTAIARGRPLGAERLQHPAVALRRRASREHRACGRVSTRSRRATRRGRDAASALIVAAAETAGPDGAEQPWAIYDTGQAVAHLSVQAQHEGLAVHQLGGFDRDCLAAVLPPRVTPIAVLAVGRRDDPARLAEPFAGREVAARERLPLEALQLVVEPRPAGAAA